MASVRISRFYEHEGEVAKNLVFAEGLHGSNVEYVLLRIVEKGHPHYLPVS